ncbi:MAG: hypothetical protein A2095_06180 [Sphingomonadales bacterium GWF1_63_6]|jgi:hypothetical protein|nr:MAG: hypothetical protein A2095_06180 [Sphingomonadales bacterium GWF1_63_6]
MNCEEAKKETSANSDLAGMHRSLIDLVATLEASIDTAPSAAAIAAISSNIVDVNARVTAAGRLLLVAQTDEVARLSKATVDIISDVERSIKDMEQIDMVVTSVAAVLKVADGAIEAANMVRG